MVYNVWFFSSIIESVFPPKCIVCEEILNDAKVPVCADCDSRINWLTSGFFSSKLPKVHFDTALSIAAYDGAWMDVVHRFKYNRRTDLARPLAGYLSRRVNYEYDLIVPVPLHPKRLRSRSYNQSALLAKELSRLCGFKTGLTRLKRVRETKDQVGLSRAERMANVKGAFTVYSSSEDRPWRTKSKSKENWFSTSSNSIKDILLIDDVMTTGATVNECARVLKRAGAKRVDVITLARTL